MEENPERTVENFTFVSCAEVKEESEECDNKEVKNFAFVSCAEVKEESEECDNREVSTFEEISIPECDVNIKEEVDETAALAASPVLERDPLKVEGEEEVDTAGWSGPDSNRLMKATNPAGSASAARRPATTRQLQTGSLMSGGSASCTRLPKGRHRKPTPSMDGDELGDFTCSSCQQMFPSKYTLLMHVFIHIRGVQPPVHICRLCGEVFATQRSLQMHSKIKENQCVVPKTGDRGLGSSKERGKGSSVQNILCPRDAAEDRHDNLSFIEVRNNIFQTDSNNSDSRKNSISKDVTLHKKKLSETRKGPNAHKSLKPPSHWKQCKVVHSVDPPYRCKDCGRYFKHQVHLQQHIASHRKKPFECRDCGRCFHRPVDLRQHVMSHTGERPHVCKCGKSFIKSGSLKRHEMVHRGERPYTCDVCLKSFTDPGVLKKHAVVHTGERAYRCGDCGKCFKELGHLRRHKLLHTGEKPYVCRYCGNAFTQSASLKRHTRVHTGERPYTCAVCSKSFADRSNFRVHSASHSRGGDHKCAMCEKRFSDRSGLVRHVRVHIL